VFFIGRQKTHQLQYVFLSADKNTSITICVLSVVYVFLLVFYRVSRSHSMTIKPCLDMGPKVSHNATMQGFIWLKAALA